MCCGCPHGYGKRPAFKSLGHTCSVIFMGDCCHLSLLGAGAIHNHPTNRCPLQKTQARRNPRRIKDQLYDRNSAGSRNHLSRRFQCSVTTQGVWSIRVYGSKCLRHPAASATRYHPWPPSSLIPGRVQHFPGALKDKTSPAAARLRRLHVVHPAPGNFAKPSNHLEIGPWFLLGVYTPKVVEISEWNLSNWVPATVFFC